MDIRVLLFLFVLSTGWCCNARVVTTYSISTQNEIASVLEINHQHQEREVDVTEEFGKNKELCTLCEEYSALALGYLAENKTQTEIIAILHKTCSKLLNLEEQCMTLVDYYAPLFFLEASKVQPEEFCGRIDLCQQVVSISQHLSKGSCEFCHHAVAEALLKLKDPDTQVEIIAILHKTCSNLLNLEEQCMTLVDYYAPLFFLEVSKVQPEEFCGRIGLCEQSQNLSKGRCEFCHHAVEEALLKLKDPDTQLDIVELLLKLCDAEKSHAKKCKTLVFVYAPLIVVNAEKFLEKQDICTLLHACSSPPTTATEQASSSETSMHSAY